MCMACEMEAMMLGVASGAESAADVVKAKIDEIEKQISESHLGTAASHLAEVIVETRKNASSDVDLNEGEQAAMSFLVTQMVVAFGMDSVLKALANAHARLRKMDALGSMMSMTAGDQSEEHVE